MQFDRAEFEGQHAQAAGACAICKKPLEAMYFTFAGHAICGTCKEGIAAEPPGNPVERVARAGVAGTGAAIAGTLGYFGFIAATGFDLSLITIGIGWLVGRAVRWGSHGRGGLGYQALAVYLTYVSIGAAYTLLGFSQDWPDPLTLVIGGAISMHIAPVAVGAANIISILIIGFGLLQAWRMNRSVLSHIAGPFPVGAPAAHG